MDFMTAKQAAEKWGLSLRWVQQLLQWGRIEGATRFGRDYMIPITAKKPEDNRKHNGRKPDQKGGQTARQSTKKKKEDA